jgi:hypothetical protein
MLRKSIFWAAIIIALLFNNDSFAQSGGVNFTLAFPMGEFKDNVDRLGYGGSVHFLFWDQTSKLPFSFGLNLGFINYGSESRREPFSHTIPDVTVDVDRSNNLVNFHLLFQIAPPPSTVTPYAELLFGGSYLFTETQIKSRGIEEVASSTNFDDFAWSYGGGGGLMILLNDNISDDVGALFLDLKVRYLLGTEAEYLKEGSVTIIDGDVHYDVTRSKTDLLTAHLGVVAYFNAIF